ICAYQRVSAVYFFSGFSFFFLGFFFFFFVVALRFSRSSDFCFFFQNILKKYRFFSPFFFLFFWAALRNLEKNIFGNLTPPTSTPNHSPGRPLPDGSGRISPSLCSSGFAMVSILILRSRGGSGGILSQRSQQVARRHLAAGAPGIAPVLVAVTRRWEMGTG